MSSNEGSYAAEFKLDTRRPPHRLTKEHCMAKRRQIVDIGRDRNQQVRIEFPTANGTISAIYTVSVFHSHAGLVILGEKIYGLLANCKLSNTNTCEGRVKAQIMIDGLDDYKANERGELIEHLSHDSQNHKLVVIAPHGGDIEEYTDKQAEYVGKQFSSDRVSLWICKGFSNKGRSDALERWHITSTEISEKSFPKLNTIFGPKFEYSIAFHGWTKDFICVGGSKQSADNGLIREIKDAIKNTLIAYGSNIDVRDSECPECQEEFNGNSTDNIVNRLGTNGIQIEQCLDARKQYYTYIAKAVADVIRSRLDA
jgi:phage replication-related protein YjqB (UPF0714/DUF867 family)